MVWSRRGIHAALTSCIWGHVTALVCPDLYRSMEICVQQQLGTSTETSTQLLPSQLTGLAAAFSATHPKFTPNSSSSSALDPGPAALAGPGSQWRVPMLPFHIAPPQPGQCQGNHPRSPQVPEVPEAFTLLLPVLASLHRHFPHVASEEALTIPGSVPRMGSTPKAQPFLHRQRCRRSAAAATRGGVLCPPLRFLGKTLK